MARLCTICIHPERDAIEAELLTHQYSYRNIADHYAVEYSPLYRHEHVHLHSSLRQSREVRAMLGAEALAAKMAALDEDAHTLREWGHEAHDPRTLAMGIAQGRNNVETLMRLIVLHAAERQQEAQEEVQVVPAQLQEATVEQARAVMGEPERLRTVLRMLMESGAAIEPEEATAREHGSSLHLSGRHTSSLRRRGTIREWKPS